MINRTGPKVSIVIPSFNQGQFIRQTLESLLQQSYANVEIIVCDGGSTDETKKILQSYGKRISWISKPDKGQTDALNKGFRMASGEILGYLNSDDYLLEGALEMVVKAFQTHPQTLWLTGDYVIVGESGESRDAFIALYKRVQRIIMRYLPFLRLTILGINNPLVQPSTFWRKELLDKVGELNEDLRYTMDYDFWWRAWRFGAPLFLEKKLSAFRIHGKSKGGTQYEKQMTEQLQVAESHGVRKGILLLQKMHNSGVVWWYKRTK